jgi:hypothetical protein
MPESIQTRMTRWGFNLYPCYRGSGGRITYIASDWREIHVKLPLNWRTRNYRGTIFGGSIYGAVDPMYMIMLIRNLGPAYNVWDKGAQIRFRAPGKETLFARFQIDQKELDAIQDALDHTRSTDREYHIELVDAAGQVHAEVGKTVYVSKRV